MEFCLRGVAVVDEAGVRGGLGTLLAPFLARVELVLSVGQWVPTRRWNKSASNSSRPTI